MEIDTRFRVTPSSWWIVVAAAGLVTASLLLAPHRAPAAPTSSPTIEIKNHMYVLPTVTVPVGATVTWVNHDDDVHTVTSTTARFRSPGLDIGDSYSHRFSEPGAYPYFCTLHPLMVGKVIVK